jgi:transcriptional regulator with XRE-family HTH domain
VCMMAAKANPTAPRRQLGAELRRLRENAQRTVAVVATAMDWSESKLSRIETASIGIRPADLDILLEFYGVTDTERERLAGLAGQSRQRAKWGTYGDSLATAYENFIGFEAEASAICTFEPQVVPGLLQTNEYAAAVTNIDHTEDPELVEQRVAVRMARQAILTRKSPPQLCAIVDEAVIRRPIGGANVMRRQLLHLVQISEMSMITIQVLPFAAGVHRGLTGNFVILDFDGPAEHPLVYCEGMTGGVIRTNADEIDTYKMSFEALRATSLSPSDSADFINEVARGKK